MPVPANLITGVIDQLPIGTGEGLIEGLFGEVPVSNPEKGKPQSERRQVNWNVVVYVDEGEALTALSSRNGATTLPTLRSIWSDATLGTAVPVRREIVGLRPVNTPMDSSWHYNRSEPAIF